MIDIAIDKLCIWLRDYVLPDTFSKAHRVDEANSHTSFAAAWSNFGSISVHEWTGWPFTHKKDLISTERSSRALAIVSPESLYVFLFRHGRLRLRPKSGDLFQ